MTGSEEARALGAAAGADYVRNSLRVPYVFQSQPVLRGFKTLLDLDTDNYAAAFDFGLQLRPTSKVTIGLSYRPRTVINTEGSATGNAAAQLQALGGAFAAVDPNFIYEPGFGPSSRSVSRLGLNGRRSIVFASWPVWIGSTGRMPSINFRSI